jgi:uncharacterized repeat protein (TIGR04052 family)
MFFCIWGLLAACSPKSQPIEHKLTELPIELNITPYYAQQAINCDMLFTHMAQNWQIERLAFFVSDMQYKLADSEQWQTLSFVKSPWQTPQTALIWYANDCNLTEEGQQQEPQQNTLQNTRLVMQNFDAGKATMLRFSLSVPFAQNHLNPLTQASPLNNPSMFWSWRVGHKFLRLDISSQAAQQQWSFHLGSLGCESQSSLRPPERACAQPNRFYITIELDSGSELRGLNFDLAALLINIDMASMPPCMFDASQDASCARLLSNLQNNPMFTTNRNAASALAEPASDISSTVEQVH